MGKYRPRFNEKARSGMVAKQKALKAVRNKQFTRAAEPPDSTGANGESQPPTYSTESEENPNSEILKPMTAAEKEERKRKLTEALYSQNEKESKMSRAKKKRLDKYIEHQIKREEKKELLSKLAQTRIDTRMLAPSKLLGTGKQTRREEMIEALELERQGRADDRTREILYEERELKDWQSDEENGNATTSTNLAGASPEEPQSTFIDMRPQKFGGSGTGFGFTNLPKKEKAIPKKKYTWRLKVEQEEKKRQKMDDQNDFVSSEENSETDEEDIDSISGSSESSDPSMSEASDFEGFDQNSASGSESERIGKELRESHEKDGNDENDDSEGDEEEDDEDDEEESRLMQSKTKHSEAAESFKAWAEEQVRKMEGTHEMVLPELQEETKRIYGEGIHHDARFSDDENSIPINSDLKRKSFYVSVTRPIETQERRMQLPVFGEEHKIMEAIHHHDCIVLCGETGSGKTTQVPQFLYEAGFGNLQSDLYPGMIGVTQPRRVAAVSMANRVSAELGEIHGKRVGYQIRFDATVKNEGQADGTAVKFMTDGVLLREMMSDFLLSKYSALIIDEAHERNVNTDILIGMLSRVVRLRRDRQKPLKLIIMSATLRVSDFTENKQLFAVPPPIINVEARQFPVSIHFNKRTKHDYLDEAFNKTCKIHRRLPPGGILVFLTGQNEINTILKRLRTEFPFKKTKGSVYSESYNTKYRVSKNVDLEAEDIDLDIALRERKEEEAERSETSADDDSDEEEEGFDEEREDHQADDDPLYVLPLYSMLPTKEQMKVFEEPPARSRLCVVATNVAETSLTIPGIRYVVDCGRSKERKYDKETGVQSFEVDWISKASADQRAGRAGRTGPGHCYRLFSSAVYEEFFEKFSVPEILRMPVESTVLTMKSMGIDHIVNFPFPTPPDRVSLAKAEQLLTTLGALDKFKKQITSLGRTMALFPLSPRFAKILIVGNQLDCLPYVIAIVSALSVGDPFIDEHEVGIADEQVRSNKQNEDTSNSDSEDDKPQKPVLAQGELERRRKLRQKYYKSRSMFSRLDSYSDAFKFLSAVCAADHVSGSKQATFFKDHFLREKVMQEIQKLRKQIAYIVASNVSLDTIAEKPTSQQKLGVPSKEQLAAMKQIIASGFIDQVAIRSDVLDSDIKLSKHTSIISVPYSTVYPSSSYGADVEPHIYIHPNSIICHSGAAPPQYLVYQTLNRGSNHKEGQLVRLRMKPLVDISGRQLSNMAKSSLLLTYSKPLGHPYEPKLITPTKRECYVVPRFGAALGDGGLGWDLPVVKVTQIKTHGSWVISEG